MATPTAVTEAAAASNGERESHPFLHFYGQLSHQQNMLADLVRTGTYKRAIQYNAADFAGKVVLDLGCGSGILSLFAAQAGARKVFAVEAAPEMAEMARLLVSANGLSHVIEVITGKVEEIADLPEQVDLIVSEPIGFLLVHERMLESYIVARERFLKQPAAEDTASAARMFPSRATIRVQPFSDAHLHQELDQHAHFWYNNTDFFGVNLQALHLAAQQQSFRQPVIGYVDPQSLIGSSASAAGEHVIDFETAKVREDLAEIDISLRFLISRTSVMHGVACWFEADFLGSQCHIRLDTAPDRPGTHWYQVRLMLAQPIAVNAGQTVVGRMLMRVNRKFSYDITLECELEGTREVIRSVNHIALNDPYYSYLYSPPQAAAAAAAPSSSSWSTEDLAKV